jgi:hypothetical protein
MDRLCYQLWRHLGWSNALVVEEKTGKVLKMKLRS